MSSLFGTAAYVPPYKYCSSWGYRKQGDDDNVKYCKGYSYTEEKYVKGTICRKIRTGDSDEYRMSPEHCSRTYRYVEVYTEGAQQGPTHYF
ncbi:hypothetical protein [Hahella ganghwensis]|uniref:hypothetical protein n=1 Tax=Hahella ganghwensis TaxID=286420 RepID=UPI001FE0D6A0|nr:hypothetical protein [Hahella ganghwensis]